MSIAKVLLQKSLRIFGLEAYRRANMLGFGVRKALSGSGNIASRNMHDALCHIAKKGFYPKTVIDVGVAQGTFALYESFPKAHLILIEAIHEYEPELKEISRKYHGDYVIAAATSVPGEIAINVHNDHMGGSSVLSETMEGDVNGFQRKTKALRVDDLIKDKNLPGPYLLKVDVQGAELDVLEGASGILDDIQLILLEVSMFQFMKGAPQFYDVIEYMKQHGFVAYDIYGASVRPLDGALGQVDIAFVKESGIFRLDHSYATVEQWSNMTGR